MTYEHIFMSSTEFGIFYINILIVCLRLGMLLLNTKYRQKLNIATQVRQIQA